MKIRTSAKIAIGFIVLLLAGYFGCSAYTSLTVMRMQFPPIKPGHVSIVGIEAGKGYRILVANQAAQLIQGGHENFDNQSGPENEDVTSKKRVPIREMLQAMQGDEAALGQFIAIMNDIQETEEWPTERIEWQDEDLRKAIAGDPKLKAKLESDINMHLDGTPLDKVSVRAMQNGIIVETRIPCKVQVGDQVKELRGPIQIPYRPIMVKVVENRLKNRDYNEQTMANYYADEGQQVLAGKSRKEDIGKAILDLLDSKKNQEYAQVAERVLQSAKVVCTGDLITHASFENYEAGGQDLNDLTIELTDEGRNRLWQYSHNKVGSQLLLIVNGVAIAAPRIRHELAQGRLQITQMPDKISVQDAVDEINRKTGN